MLNCQLLVNVVSLVAGAAAAYLWWRSAIAQVTHAEAQRRNAGGGGLTVIGRDGVAVNILETMNVQSKWNRYAAISACIAALAQVVDSMLKIFF